MTECAGSSPHARGARHWVRWQVRRAGIIPACAGSTRAIPSCRLCAGDHPCMRGEYRTRYAGPHVLLGSSPHARGALLKCKIPPLPGRIIPACAGSTRSTPRSRPPSRDHPRMRGEHPLPLPLPLPLAGSSPHARGALRRLVFCAGLSGIIPACAGSTASRFAFALACGDHPRKQGEHHDARLCARWGAGSSPHARGAPWRTPCGTGGGRIIPACAGST